MSDHIYLDFNASTPLRPSVMAAMTDAMQHFGNPSSIHKYGRAARSLIDSARDIIANSVGVTAAQVVFTSGGTEANNTAVKAHERVLKSAIEHESVDRSTPTGNVIPIQQNGTLDLVALDTMLAESPDITLVSVMLANNETGILQPLHQVVELSRKHGAKVHCDAVTAFTKVPINYDDLGVDYLTVSAHKIGGPKGCGAVILPPNEQLPAHMHGGGQERGHRAGTENILGIVGFAQAVQESVNDDWGKVRLLRNGLEEKILSLSDAVIYGKDIGRLPNTSYIGMPGVPTQKQLMAFDLEGFAVSSGSACSSGKVSPSHVLKAMGQNDQQATEALRVSLGWTTTPAEVDAFAKTWAMLYERFKKNGEGNNG